MAHNHRNYPFGKPDDYWKLKTYDKWPVRKMLEELEARNYETGYNKRREYVVECIQRSDQGLISFAKRDNDELRLFIDQRQILTSFKDGCVGHRWELIDLIERADRDRRFKRFMDLPPELRARVYDFYFKEFMEPLHTPKQPPLTLTCHIIRKEALPLFYASCTFALNLHFCIESPDYSTLNPLTVRIRDDTVEWLDSCGPQNIADVQHIRIGLSRDYDPTANPANTMMTIDLRYNKNMLQPVVLDTSVVNLGRTKPSQAQLQQVIDDMWQASEWTGEHERLKMRDFGVLRMAAEKILFRES